MLNVETTRAYRALVVSLFLAGMLVGMISLQGKAEAKENGPIVASDSLTNNIVKVDPTTGQRTEIPGAVGNTPTVTPDGKTVIYHGCCVEGDPGDDVTYYDLMAVPIDGSAAPTPIGLITPVPVEYTWKSNPVVSPDGQTIYFHLYYEDTNQGLQWAGLASVPISGGNITEVVKDDSEHDGLSITPDGQNLVWGRPGGIGAPSVIQTVPVQGGTPNTIVQGTPDDPCAVSVTDPTISADGKTIAMKGYDSCDSAGTGELRDSAIYTAPFSTTSTSAPVVVPNTEVRDYWGDNHSDTVEYPSFSPDGQSLSYTKAHEDVDSGWNMEIMSVPAAGGGTPTVIMPSANLLLYWNEWAPKPAISTDPEPAITTDPANGATEVAKTIQPKATFDTDLDQSTVNTNSVKLEVYNAQKNQWELVSSTPSYDSGSKSITVKSARQLLPRKEYRVTLSTAIKDSTGGELAFLPYSWSFTTK